MAQTDLERLVHQFRRESARLRRELVARRRALAERGDIPRDLAAWVDCVNETLDGLMVASESVLMRAAAMSADVPPDPAKPPAVRPKPSRRVH